MDVDAAEAVIEDRAEVQEVAVEVVDATNTQLSIRNSVSENYYGDGQNEIVYAYIFLI